MRELNSPSADGDNVQFPPGESFAIQSRPETTLPDIRPSPGQLSRLKSPLGRLIRGTPSETMPELKKLIGQLKPAKIVTVGDVVSTEARAAGINVSLGIIDGKTMRHEYAQSPKTDNSVLLNVANPAGTITEQAWKVVKDGMGKMNATIFVEGEEDLLTLPAVLEAPDGAFVVYGQPSEGIVLVLATQEKKAQVRRVLEDFASA